MFEHAFGAYMTYAFPEVRTRARRCADMSDRVDDAQPGRAQVTVVLRPATRERSISGRYG